jgi:signal transduction histidine kinase
MNNPNTDALQERIKELKCLYFISGLQANKHLTLEEIMKQVVQVIPQSMQYPDQASARIVLRGKILDSANYAVSPCTQKEPIQVNGNIVGGIEVAYSVNGTNAHGMSFLPEEKMLLRTISDRLVETVMLRDAESELLCNRDRLRSLVSQVTLAEERERRRLALELHDRVGQGLAVVKLKLESIKQLSLTPAQAAKVDDLKDLLNSIVKATRSLTSAISPPILYELDFGQSLGWLVEYFNRQFEIPIELSVSQKLIFLPESIRIMLFRCVQELLMNMIKHAKASSAKVSVEYENKVLQVEVSDNGIGFDADSSNHAPVDSECFGLFSIKERLEYAGGKMEIVSGPGKGTSVKLNIAVGS